jgi:hypothetical protein
MAELAELLREWRAADSIAFAAESTVVKAMTQLAAGTGPGPTDEMAARAVEFRRRATKALEKALTNPRESQPSLNLGGQVPLARTA